ncbi:hypothetical protein [Micromonospora ureilytica]|uniref:hypothetical protein n=1 Tax=Micromonospora ureilytica TaxID=709868 RepID=UPI004039DC6D
MLSLVEAGGGRLAYRFDVGGQTPGKVTSGVGEGDGTAIVVHESLPPERVDVWLNGFTGRRVEEWRQGIRECRERAAAIGVDRPRAGDFRAVTDGSPPNGKDGVPVAGWPRAPRP